MSTRLGAAGLAVLPTGVTWRRLLGVAWLGGIGFTMSLFLAERAFADAALLDAAKLGVLAASLVAAAGGWGLLRWDAAGSPRTVPPPTAGAAEAPAPGAAGGRRPRRTTPEMGAPHHARGCHRQRRTVGAG